MTVNGALDLAGGERHVALAFVGEPRLVESLIRAHPNRLAPEVEVIPTDEFITHHDSIADVLRRKPRSSMRLALRALGEHRVDAMVSAGNTGALVALARRELRMLGNIDRPALIKPLPGSQGPFWMLDLGATIHCDAAQLVQFAFMGAVVAEKVGNRRAPRVALLNIGEEPGKGSPAIQEAARILDESGAVDYVGFIEAHRLFDGLADVVVADGFTGNVALKAIEGSAAFARDLVTSASKRAGWIEKLGLLLARRVFTGLTALWNPQEYNGASLIGLEGVVVKSHGGADRRGFARAVEEAMCQVGVGLPNRLLSAVG